MPRKAREAPKTVGVLYDNISGNTGDVAIGLSLTKILRELRVEFDELVPGRFNPRDYEKIVVGGGYLLRPSPDFFYDKFKVVGNHVLNACGIAGLPEDLHYLDEYAYVSVRSTGDKRKLHYLKKDVRVVPCTSMLLEDARSFKLPIQEPSVGVHLTPGFLDQRSEERFANFLSSLGLNVYLLPMTHYQQDSLYLNKLRLKLPGSELIPILKAREILTVIGRFDYFISMSLHGALFSYVHKVPFILVDREKTRFFMEDRGLERYLFADFHGMRRAFQRLLRSPPDYSKTLSKDYRTLREHIRTLGKTLPRSTGRSYVSGVDREILRRQSVDELNAQVQHLQLLTIDLAAQIKASEQELSVKSIVPQQLQPLGRLLALYASRRDLRSAFPEVRNGDYSRLLQWARDALAAGTDSASSVFADYAKWYRKNTWLKLMDQLSQVKEELSQSQLKIEAKDAERSQLIGQLSQVKEELSQSQLKIEAKDAERSQLIGQLNQIKKDVEDIRHSFGYKFMKFYASRIDRLLPDGTFRGRFRKIVVTSLRIMTEESIGTFARKALEKIKRREFAVVEPLEARMVNETRLRGMRPGKLSDEDLERNLKDFQSSHDATLAFPVYKDPLVSIIIVTHNKALYTYQCLCSLLANSLPPYEIIIVDNASSDETSLLLRRTRNVVAMKNRSNQFFARACNQGARTAKGEYLLFLNSDAFVYPGCISSLVKTLNSAPNIGAAGAKLVSREGDLQEAGCIIWRDGGALGYGRGDDPSKPEYCYTRDVDYCSAACLIVRRDAFEKLGGFDEAFTPAYYEDTDLCTRLWNEGFRVVYQPLAVATHVEFASSSFESATRLMEKQRLVFVAKHEKPLEDHIPFSERNIIRARNRGRRPAILVIDDCVPKPDEGSGFPRMFLMLKSMASSGYRVTLLPLTDATAKQPETDILTQTGVEVLWDSAGMREVLQVRQDAYDIIIISRPHNALLALGLARETNPRARVIYDAEALYYRREQLGRRLGLSPADPRFESEEAELSIIRSADHIITVSEEEKRIIEEKVHEKGKVMLWAHPHALNPTETAYEERSDILFVGGFKSSPAHNDDAVIYFANAMLPRIQERIPGSRFIIAGSNPPESVRRLSSNSIIVTGYLKDLRQLYEKSRIFVAPIRFGAGAMWKVTEAMSYGLPCVLSTIAAQGLGITDGEEALVAHDEKDFIEKTVRLYQDNALWNHIRKRELEYIANNNDPVLMDKKLREFLEEIMRSRAD